MEDIQAFICNLDNQWQKDSCLVLLDLQQRASTEIDASIKWKNPYFSCHGRALLKWYCAKEWINVYFFQGVRLDDPDNLFEATDNKSMRTIKLFEKHEFNQAAYIKLVQAAVQLC